ncbi:MAG: hypothetical protein FJ379_12835 [Verrucomicrobia bacterium]|nr:hypothetical protein [Verrucomicrobiota bacterium]
MAILLGPSRKPDRAQHEDTTTDYWPRRVKVGVHEIRIYRDTLPSGSTTYRVEDRTGPHRRLIRYKTLDAAERAARDIGRRLKTLEDANGRSVTFPADAAQGFLRALER